MRLFFSGHYRPFKPLLIVSQSSVHIMNFNILDSTYRLVKLTCIRVVLVQDGDLFLTPSWKVYCFMYTLCHVTPYRRLYLGVRSDILHRQ